MIDELLEFVERAEDHAELVAQLSLLKSVKNEAGFATHIYEQVERAHPVAVA
jgi:hypothetical protein